MIKWKKISLLTVLTALTMILSAVPAMAAPLDLNDDTVVVQLARKYYLRRHGTLTELAELTEGDKPYEVHVTLGRDNNGSINPQDIYTLDRRTLKGTNAYGEAVDLFEERGEYTDPRLEHLAKDYYHFRKGKAPDVSKIVSKPDKDTVVIRIANIDQTTGKQILLEEYTIDRRLAIGTDLHEREINLLHYSDTYYIP